MTLSLKKHNPWLYRVSGFFLLYPTKIFLSVYLSNFSSIELSSDRERKEDSKKMEKRILWCGNNMHGRFFLLCVLIQHQGTKVFALRTWLVRYRTREKSFFTRNIPSTLMTSNQSRLPAELKHINKRRKRN